MTIQELLAELGFVPEDSMSASGEFEPIIGTYSEQSLDQHLNFFGGFSGVDADAREVVDGIIRKYEADMQMEAEHAEEERTGRKKCPKCGLFAVKVRSVRTRQYGGGYDTFYNCENCDYSEVCV